MKDKKKIPDTTKNNDITLRTFIPVIGGIAGGMFSAALDITVNKSINYANIAIGMALGILDSFLFLLEVQSNIFRCNLSEADATYKVIYTKSLFSLVSIGQFVTSVISNKVLSIYKMKYQEFISMGLYVVVSGSATLFHDDEALSISGDHKHDYE